MPTFDEYSKTFSEKMFERYNKTPNAKNFMNSLKETKELCSKNKILLVGYYLVFGLTIILLCGILSFFIKIWRYEHSLKFFALTLFFVGIVLLSYKLEIIL